MGFTTYLFKEFPLSLYVLIALAIASITKITDFLQTDLHILQNWYLNRHEDK